MQEICLSIDISNSTTENQAEALWSTLATLINLRTADISVCTSDNSQRVPIFLYDLPLMTQMR